MEKEYNLKFVRSSEENICNSLIYFPNLTKEKIEQLREDGLRKLQKHLNRLQIRN